MDNLAAKLWVGIMVPAFAFGGSIIPAQAQSPLEDGIKLTISPIPISIAAQPGQLVTHELEVRNSGVTTETLVPRLLTFSAFNENGEPQLREPTSDDRVVDWVQFTPDQTRLDPLEWGRITMTIDIPDDAAFGYYFAVTWGRSQPENQPTATNIIGSVAQLILLEVPVPGAERKLELESFEVDRGFYEFLPVGFTARIRNTGNLHVAPFGNIFIKDSRGRDVGTIRINPEKGNILPESIRMFRASWNEGFPRYIARELEDQAVLDEAGRPVMDLEWNVDQASWWRFGKYTAHLVMAYNQGDQDVPMEAEVDFWIIPWRLILLAIIIPILPAVLVYVIMRHQTKKIRADRV